MAATKLINKQYLATQFQNYNTNVVLPMINTKVDKIPGYNLSKNDFTDALKAKLESLIDRSAYDVLVGRVTAAENAINLLNDDATTEGSVAKTVADSIAAIVASAPEDFDTLKEISDWISDHTDSAASMNSQIQSNTSAIALLNNNENTEGSVAHAIKTAKDAIDEDIGDLDTRMTAAETAIDLLNDDDSTEGSVAYAVKQLHDELEYAIEDVNIDFTQFDLQDIVISGKSSVATNDTLQLTSNIAGVTWTSSDSEIATVSASGVVTPVATGEVNITASKNGYDAATKAITVIAPTTMNISGDSEVDAGSTITLTTDASSGTTVTWESSDDDIATVEDGVVTGVSEGTVTITATAPGYTNATKQITVTSSAAVEPEAEAVTMIISGDSSVTMGSTITLTTNVESGTVTWESSDDSIATVEDGIVTPVAPGEVTITASAAGYTDGTKTITVNAGE